MTDYFPCHRTYLDKKNASKVNCKKIKLGAYRSYRLSTQILPIFSKEHVMDCHCSIHIIQIKLFSNSFADVSSAASNSGG